MQKVKTDPDIFIQSLPEETRTILATLDSEIAKVMNGAERVLWTGTFWGGSEQNIIGYGDLVYERKGKKTEWFLIGLASQKNYISLYVNAVEDNKYLGQIYGNDLGKVKIGASSISFKKLEDVDMEKLVNLIKKAKEIQNG